MACSYTLASAKRPYEPVHVHRIESPGAELWEPESQETMRAQG